MLSFEAATVIQDDPKTATIKEEEDSGIKLPALAASLALLGLTIPIPTSLIASVVALAAWPVAKRAYQSLTVNHKLNIDCLDFMAISLTAAQGNLLTPALVMTLHQIGDMIRDRTARAGKFYRVRLSLTSKSLQVNHCLYYENLVKPAIAAGLNGLRPLMHRDERDTNSK